MGRIVSLSFFFNLSNRKIFLFSVTYITFFRFNHLRSFTNIFRSKVRNPFFQVIGYSNKMFSIKKEFEENYFQKKYFQKKFLRKKKDRINIFEQCSATQFISISRLFAMLCYIWNIKVKLNLDLNSLTNLIEFFSYSCRVGVHKKVFFIITN